MFTNNTNNKLLHIGRHFYYSLFKSKCQFGKQWRYMTRRRQRIHCSREWQLHCCTAARNLPDIKKVKETVTTSLSIYRYDDWMDTLIATYGTISRYCSWQDYSIGTSPVLTSVLLIQRIQVLFRYGSLSMLFAPLREKSVSELHFFLNITTVINNIIIKKGINVAVRCLVWSFLAHPIFLVVHKAARHSRVHI